MSGLPSSDLMNTLVRVVSAAVSSTGEPEVTVTLACLTEPPERLASTYGRRSVPCAGAVSGVMEMAVETSIRRLSP